jgi:GTP-binding protein
MEKQLFPAEDAAWLKTGKWLFAQSCLFQGAATRVSNLPSESLSEVAFAGRSNVGKSSLINALVNQKKLARVSNTPGRTQEINFFNLGQKGQLVDLPGYGYAQVSKEKRLGWGEFIFAFLKGRSVLKRVYVLIDSRHGLKPTDKDLFKALDKAAVSYQIVLTKADKLNKGEKESIIKTVDNQLKEFIAVYPKILLTSSLEGTEIEELRAEIAALFLPAPHLS